jgi:hypothetical protein
MNETELSLKKQSEINSYLHSHGIKRNSRQDLEYLNGKSVIFKGMMLKNKELYQKICKWIADYVGL